ncbi:YonK family protein [Brevibacillus porteri]|uniref:YonK family protein n=1 Tax=Brevibacillus porteri TaxID=2126350 RepID=UPI003645489A
MAKHNSSFAVTGLLDMDMMRITEKTKDAINTFDLLKILGKYDGQQVKITVSIDSDDSEFLADDEDSGESDDE